MQTVIEILVIVCELALCFVAGLVIISILYIIIYFFIDWRKERSSTATRISFKRFKKLYSIYPQKWELFDYHVEYTNKKDDPPHNDEDTVRVEFSHFHDVLMFIFFCTKLAAKQAAKQKRADSEQRLAEEERFIKLMQSDIKIYIEENEELLKKVAEEQAVISRNMESGR